MSRESAPSPGRIVSMDQFRGYTVAGMFLVNFVGGYAAIAEVLKHHSDRPYFSYADTIMPSFMFAAGFSFRLSALRRLAQIGPAQTYWKFFVRSLGLVLVSMVLFGPGDFGGQELGRAPGLGNVEVHRRADQGQPLGDAGDHRRDPDLPAAGHRRQQPGPGHRPGGVCPGPRPDLALVQLLLRLRQAELAG